jgi:hypothetical protein
MGGQEPQKPQTARKLNRISTRPAIQANGKLLFQQEARADNSLRSFQRLLTEFQETNRRKKKPF